MAFLSETSWQEHGRGELSGLSKKDLHSLADGLVLEDQWSIDRCVEFVIAETRNIWHGRARAMMCRRLKHCTLGRQQNTQLVKAISNRLANGEFSEQFKDQLRLAMCLDMKTTLAAAKKILDSNKSYPKSYVIRYAQWVLRHEKPPMMNHHVFSNLHPHAAIASSQRIIQ
jgi:hypothetical protein